MGFDSRKYIELTNEFICKSEKIREFRAPEFLELLKPLCAFLHIGRLEASIRSTSGMLKNNVNAPYVYYDSGNYDRNRVLTGEAALSTTEAGTAVYTVYADKDSPDWTDQELKQINVLKNLIFIMGDRNYALKLAREMTVQDANLGVYSLPFFLSTMRSLIEKGELGGFGVVYFNLRRFSAINEHIGREMANCALRGFIGGLQERLHYEECICRLGGDNFVMLFRKDNLPFIQNYLSGTAVIYDSSADKVNVSTTAGCYLIPAESTETETEVMDKVSTAIQLARTVYKRDFLFYDEHIMRQQEKIKEIEDIFPKAIRDEEFHVYYQPKTQLESNELAGAEALCRWYRDGKIVPPGDFIPVLEGSKAICTLDFYMLDHVCSDIRRWLDEGRRVVKVSVNLSRLHLGDQDLLESILQTVDKHNVPHEYIEIELTETTTDVDYVELKKIVNGLRDQGISTSVDDFGIGYSSLNLIREMPWNVLKIDKSFLPDMEEKQDPTKVKMLRHIITMSQDLGLECLVEGVETKAQVKLLLECKCYLAQGFYFDKPLPVSEFEKRLDYLRAC